MKQSGVALVTTVWVGSRERGSRQVDVLSAFLLYHTSIGVDHVFVFFDGDSTQQPAADALHDQVQQLVTQGRIELFYRNNGVQPTGVDSGHGGSSSNDDQVICASPGKTLLRYSQCRNYERLRPFIATDVSSRQMLHAELAMQCCAAHNQTNALSYTPGNKNIQWLLHLDLDELFFCESFTTSPSTSSTTNMLHQFVSSLEQDGIDQLTILNYEAVPTTRLTSNFFVSCTKFRRHTSRIPLTSKAQQALTKWQSRSPYNQFFLFYDNGKSIVRVPREQVDGESVVVVPASVHHWKPLTSGDGATPNPWRSVSNFYDPRRSSSTTSDGSATTAAAAAAYRCCVLHYPVCGLEWLTEKYERLQDFPAIWGGGTSLPMQPCFHLQARDAVARTAAAAAVEGGADEAAAAPASLPPLEMLYESQVMVVDDPGFWHPQIDAGVCEEITFARELLVTHGLAVDRAPCVVEDSSNISTATTSAAVNAHAGMDNHSNSLSQETYTVQKAWMLAAISDQYL